MNRNLFYLTNRHTFRNPALETPFPEAARAVVKGDDPGLAELADHLGLSSTITDWYAVSYLKLLANYPEMLVDEPVGETYDNLWLLPKDPVVTQGMEIRHDANPVAQVQPGEPGWPVNFNWKFLKVDMKQARVIKSDTGGSAVIPVNVWREDGGENILFRAGNFFPYNLKFHTVGVNGWTESQFEEFELYMEPDKVPFQAIIDDLPDQSVVNTILRNHGLFQDYMHATYAPEAVAVIIGAIIRERRKRHE
jgi:hypothetical protein